MPGKHAFWDSSALIPLLVRQDATDSARQLLRMFPDLVVSWTTPVEINSALARLAREGELSSAGRDMALSYLGRFASRWVEIVPTEEVRVLAAELLHVHDLRAADALQLSSALVWCNRFPRKRPLITLDQRLASAAAAAGFDLRS